MLCTINTWVVPFDSQMNQLDEFQRYLSKDEIQRARAFAFQHLTNQFMICRGFLRKVLSEFLNVHPKNIKFLYGENGKPEIGSPENLHIQFNLSHAGKFFVIGVLQKTMDPAVNSVVKPRCGGLLRDDTEPQKDAFPIGIDVEYHNPNIELFDVAAEVFSPNEIKKIASLPHEQQLKEFYRIWTIKEAFIKAIGKGFSFNPKWIETHDQTRSFRALSIDFNAEFIRAGDWFFSELSFDPTYSMAIVTHGSAGIPIHMRRAV